jgi:hypothetical protein
MKIMGDICNQNDLDRILRSPEGQSRLNEFREILRGRIITDVSFSNEVWSVATTLHLDGGDTFVIFQPSLDVDALREEFGNVLKREYYVDYPERRPKEPIPAESE